jgi:hypothetical protein
MTRTDIIFSWTFAIAGTVTFSYGLDTCLDSSWHGAGLLVAVAGLVMLGLSTVDSNKDMR